MKVIEALFEKQTCRWLSDVCISVMDFDYGHIIVNCDQYSDKTNLGMLECLCEIVLGRRLKKQSVPIVSIKQVMIADPI